MSGTLTAFNNSAFKERNKLIEKARNDRFNERKAKQAHIYNSGGEQQHQSLMDKAAHLAGLTPEGVSGEILAQQFFKLFQALFQTHYAVQKRDFSKAKRMGIAYVKDADGNFPEVRRIGADGKPDSNQPPYPQNTDVNNPEFRAAIRQNGLVPPPNWLEAQYTLAYEYIEEMMGKSALTPTQREVLHKRVEDMKAQGPQGPDLASDRAAMMAAQKPPAPAARK